VFPVSFSGLRPAARDLQAATHIQDLRFEDVAAVTLEFAEDPVA
jgi:hypothetical protein